MPAIPDGPAPLIRASSMVSSWSSAWWPVATNRMPRLLASRAAASYRDRRIWFSLGGPADSGSQATDTHPIPRAPAKRWTIARSLTTNARSRARCSAKNSVTGIPVEARARVRAVESAPPLQAIRVGSPASLLPCEEIRCRHRAMIRFATGWRRLSFRSGSGCEGGCDTRPSSLMG